MKMGYGIWIAILGILAVIVGSVMYETYHHTGKTGGEVGIILGIILIILGVAWWMMKDNKAPKTTAPQPIQPTKTP